MQVWNLFDTFLVIVSSALLAGLIVEKLSDWGIRRHEYRMAQLKQPKVVPIRKDTA